MKRFVSAVRQTFLLEVPSYGNTIFYSFGFLALTCFAMLAATGVVLVLFGAKWWLGDPAGIFFRSVHLWSAQALVLIVILHALTVFLTSGFKPPRRLTWVLGVLIAALALFEAEFGYGLRSDFSSQYRSLQAADFWNGSYIGSVLNTLNEQQVFGIHVIVIPFAILLLVATHYFLVKTLGIAKPYKPEVQAAIVEADHKKLFMRGVILAALIAVLALVFPSPMISPATIKDVADANPPLVAQTIVSEFTRTSGTATYLDSIDPYRFDIRSTYVTIPYGEYVAETGGVNKLVAWNAAAKPMRDAMATQATLFFNDATTSEEIANATSNSNPIIAAVSSLVLMAKSGAYEAVLDSENSSINPTYSLRFLADTGVLDDEATALGITTDQWGMMREEGRSIPAGAWWLSPLGALDHTVLANDPNGDRDGAEILGMVLLLVILFPYLPYVNRIPEKLHAAEWFWRRGAK